MAEKIVAIALLTQTDLDVLGTGFKRVFPIGQDDAFTDLLELLDQADATPPPPGDR